MEINREDLRKIVYFNMKDKKSVEATTNKINNIYGRDTISLSTCKWWFVKFNQGDFTTEDKPRSGRPSDPELHTKIVNILQLDPYATTRDIGEALSISHEAVRKHLMKMGKKYLVNTWVPHTLTPDNCQKRVNVCTNLLRLYETNNFLMRLITVDECWIYWENATSSYHNR